MNYHYLSHATILSVMLVAEITEKDISTTQINRSVALNFGGTRIKVRENDFGSVTSKESQTTLKWPGMLDPSDINEEIFSWFKLIEPNHALWDKDLASYCHVAVGRYGRIYSLRTPNHRSAFFQLMKQPPRLPLNYRFYTPHSKSSVTLAPTEQYLEGAFNISAQLPVLECFDELLVEWVINHHRSDIVRQASPAVLLAALK